jgi:hypothetical protein
MTGSSQVSCSYRMLEFCESQPLQQAAVSPKTHACSTLDPTASQVGAQVMLLKNLDLSPPSSSSTANGSAGTSTQAGPSSQAPAGAGASGEAGGSSGPRQQLVNGSRGVVGGACDMFAE